MHNPQMTSMPTRMRLRPARLCRLAAILLFLPTTSVQPKEVAVIITGEAHGALMPCDCPIEPDGGLARRSTLIKNLRTQYPCRIVVNVGGDAAGGPYDEDYSSPDEAVRRTDCVVEALRLMPPDAFIPGDEELAHGPQSLSKWAAVLPLASRNIDVKAIRDVIHITSEDVRFAVTGLTKPTEWPISKDMHDLVPALPEQVADPFQDTTDSHLTILVCHLGEKRTIEVTERLVAAGRTPSLVINAHSRRDPRNVVFVKGVPVAQFPPLGRKVRVALFEVSDDKKGRPLARFLRLDTHRLSPAVEPDPAVQEVVARFLREEEQKSARISLTLFKMPNCPHTPAVESRLVEILPRLGNTIEFRVRLLTPVDEQGRATSPAGEEELEESRAQAAMAAFYPNLLTRYLTLRLEEPKAPWATLAAKAGALPARIRGAILTGEADGFLSWDRAVAARLAIRTSPTLVVGNRVIGSPPMVDRALSYICSLLEKGSRPAICSTVPECFSDADCRRPGKEGECIDPGTPKAHCRHADAVRVNLTVVYPARSVRPRRHAIIRALSQFFPALEVEEIPYPSQRASALLDDYPFDTLPAYLAGAEAGSAKGYKEIRETLSRRKDGGFVFQPWAAGSSYFFKREETRGETALYVPFGTEHGRQALSSLLDYLQNAAPPKRPEVCPLIFEREGELHSPGGRAAFEEVLRVIAVKQEQPGHLQDYLAALAESKGSGYWEEPLRQAGLDPASVKTQSLSQEVRATAAALAADCNSLELPPRVALLFDNREVVLPADRGEFLDLLMERLGN